MMNINMTNISTGIFYYVSLFAMYSFIGWIIEVIYRSITQRKFVNAGFLFGPFVPLYGFGALFIILLQHLFYDWHILLRLFMFGLALTGIEYLVGYLAEKMFGLTLWDYSESRFNLHGRVSLLFSAIWAGLAFIFITFIHPVVLNKAAFLNAAYLQIVAIAFIIYSAVDYAFSVSNIKEFREKVAYLYTEYLSLNNVETEKILDSFTRLRYAFPDLNRYIDSKISNNIKKRISTVLKSVQNKIIMEIKGRKPFEAEFYELINDIYEHEEFLKLKEYFHHNSSIYEHVEDVAYFSYRICKYLKLDYRSATRGALLHDFFLYDWRNHDVPDLPRKQYHGIEHPKIAVDNAKKHFTINEIEEDIIKKHMWPLTLIPPKYKESFIVSFADKYLSSKEFVSEFKKRRKVRLDTS